MTHSPSVSVVLPARNAERTIERAIRSILEQSLSDFELIIIDDGSTDSTRPLLDGIHDPRLRVLSTDHHGVAQAANLATRTARASLIARMDADDIAHPERLAQQMHLIHESGADVVGSRVRIESTFGPVTAARGMRFDKCREVLLTWMDSTERLTRNHHRYTDNAFMQCRRHHLLQGPLAGVTSVDLWGAGSTGKGWQQWLTQHGVAVRHLYDVSAKKIGQRIHGVTVRSSEELASPDGALLVIAVGAAGARKLIHDCIVPRGYISGHDAWFVA